MATKSTPDVIIVGGGVAGLVAAARLSEGGDKHVLVIEAGKDRRGDSNIDCPGMLINLWGNPEYDWNNWSIPQVSRNIIIIAYLVDSIPQQLITRSRLTSMEGRCPSLEAKSWEDRQPSTPQRFCSQHHETSQRGPNWAIVAGQLRIWPPTTGSRSLTMHRLRKPARACRWSPI